MEKGRNIKMIIFIVTLIIVVCCGVFFILKRENNMEKTSNINENIIEEKVDPIKIYKATLIGAGDALLHSPIYNAAYNSQTDTYDFAYMMEKIKDIISQYDIKYYNQEVIFDDDKSYSSYPIFNAPSAWGRDMTEKIGFNLVSLATNHSMDCGGTSAEKNAAWWEAKENVLATGMASSEENRNKHKIMDANGITYTMLSYTYGTNGMPIYEDYQVNLFDEQTVLNDIKEVRDKVDILIVAMHWGEEYNTGVTDTQKEQAKFLAENGVDIILGNHSHCIEPWEWIDEDTIVFYSFGNFISSQMTAETPIIRKVGPVGLLGTLEITKTVDTEKNTKVIKIDNIGAEIIYTYRYYNNEKGLYDYAIIPFSKMETKYLEHYDDVYDEFSTVLKSIDENINIAPLPQVSET